MLVKFLSGTRVLRKTKPVVNIYIDIGNSRFKSAVTENDKLLPFAPVPWHDEPLAVSLDNLWAGLKPERVVVCNVAGDKVLPDLQQWCSANLGFEAEVVATAAEFSGFTANSTQGSKQQGAAVYLKNGYTEPARLGTDRWAAMIGARAHYQGALCVIDSGTATTVDLIDAQGQHLGGAILPGVYTMRRSLGKYTAALFTASGDMSPFSTDTAAGIAGGTGYASAGAIDRLIDESLQRLDDVTTVFTGGEASVIQPILRNIAVVDEQLVLKGVAVMAAA